MSDLKLTGGDWERRANEYWDNWRRSARVAGEEQMRAEQAERQLAAARLAVDAARAFIDAIDTGNASVPVEPYLRLRAALLEAVAEIDSEPG